MNPQIQQELNIIHTQMIDITNRLDNLNRSNSIPRDFEIALRERLGTNTVIPTIYRGVAAPVTIPNKVGDIFCDSTNGKVYISTKTFASTDWKLLN